MSFAAVAVGVGAIQSASDLVFTVVLLPFLVVWMLVNLYVYYPICRATGLRLVHSGRRVIGRMLPRRLVGTREGDGMARARAEEPVLLDDDALPELGILLAAYRESAVIEQSIGSALASDYPTEKLTLYVLTEPDDEETRAVLDLLSETYEFVEIVVPATYPDTPTKPRALNYGFEHTDEELLGIIDAEDIVDPSLFRLAASTMTVGNLDYTQARLDMVNEGDGWLNTLFRADYAYWFRAVLPSFAAAKYPVPLGGTSNFFRRSVLTEMSGLRLDEYGSEWDADDEAWVQSRGLAGLRPWDPRNVTEDFELGLFLWKEGKRFAYLDSVTREESPLTLDSWIRQRTRWKKGKLYTYLQYRRTPPVGLKARFHLFMQSMLPHIGPVNIVGIVLTLMIANIAGFGPGTLVLGFEFAGLGFVLLATWLHVRSYWTLSDTPYRVRTQRAVKIVITLPFYWLLQWGADIRAIYQTYNDEHDWEITEHLGRNSETADTKRPVTDEDRRERRDLPMHWLVAALTGVTLTALAVRLFDLTAVSLSGSELYWLDRATGPLGTLLVATADPQPPLSLVGLRAWTTLFGTGDVAVRSFSVLVSLVTVLALFALGTSLYDQFTGLVATGLFAIGAIQIHFARTAGPATVAVFLTVLSWYYFTRLDESAPYSGLGYVLSTAALLYTNLVGVAVLLAQVVYTSLSERKSVPGAPRIRLLQATTALLFVPWLVVLTVQPVTGSTATSSLAYGSLVPLTVTQVRTTVLALAGYPAFYPLTGGNVLTWVVAGAVSILFAVCSVFAVFSYHVDTRVRYALTDTAQAAGLAWLFLSLLVVPLAVSLVVPSVFVPEYTLAATVPLYLLVARGITNFGARRPQLVVALALVLAAAVVGSFYVDADTEEDWRGASQQLERNADSGDLVLFQPAVARVGFDHYYAGPDVETATLPASDTLTADQQRALRTRIRDRNRVWLLRYRDDAPNPALRLLRESSGQVVRTDYGVVELYQFTPVAGDT